MTALALSPTLTSNPYWDAVHPHIRPNDFPWESGQQVGGLGDWGPMSRRLDYTSTYAWTITAPATVRFVAQHAGRDAVDPLAGSGYWAYLLGQVGCEVLASDLMPPAPSSGNEWHRGADTWVPVRRADAVDAVRSWGLGRTLLLSWPPYDDPIGALLVGAFPGDRIVYIGEGEGGCCGTGEMFELLRSGWVEVAEHRPVQWYGLHDWVTVYERVQRRAVTR